MSKAPDLSAFPIPRKGVAKPIVGDDFGETDGRGGEGGDSPRDVPSPPAAETVPEPEPVVAPRSPVVTKGGGVAPRATHPRPSPRVPAPPPQIYGQTVATTVKLDENRYLRLMEAGKPGPGRLKRRTIQDMLIEALDEWFERRQL
jgi:hypothetical protein